MRPAAFGGDGAGDGAGARDYGNGSGHRSAAGQRRTSGHDDYDAEELSGQTRNHGAGGAPIYFGKSRSARTAGACPGIFRKGAAKNRPAASRIPPEAMGRYGSGAEWICGLVASLA